VKHPLALGAALLATAAGLACSQLTVQNPACLFACQAAAQASAASGVAP
jgi:hypothetical protein